MAQAHAGSIKLEKFDDLWSLGDPALIEPKFKELLPQAEALDDKSIYLQLLSQIALAQAMQRKFDEALGTIDKAEKLLTPKYSLAKARILLEKGRVFQQMAFFQKSDKDTEIKNLQKARLLFEESFELSKKNQFDFHTANAAHMIAIAAEATTEKIKWNELAIHLAESSQDTRTKAWVGSLENNLGQAYLEGKQYEKALASFQKALNFREKEAYAPNIRVAKWAIGKALRLLNRLDEAEKILASLIKEYEVLVKSGKLDFPEQMLPSMRGLVYEELAEVYFAKAKVMANLGYEDLSKDAYIPSKEPQRLERLKDLAKK